MPRPTTLVIVPRSPDPTVHSWRLEQQVLLGLAVLRDGRLPVLIPDYRAVDADLNDEVERGVLEDFGAIFGRSLLSRVLLLARDDKSIGPIERAVYRGWALARGVSPMPVAGVQGLTIVRWSELGPFMQRVDLEASWQRLHDAREIPSPMGVS